MEPTMTSKPTHTPEYVAALELALHKWEPLSGKGDVRQVLAFKDGFDAAWNAALLAPTQQPSGEVTFERWRDSMSVNWWGNVTPIQAAAAAFNAARAQGGES